jgi:hypothetical protein
VTFLNYYHRISSVSRSAGGGITLRKRDGLLAAINYRLVHYFFHFFSGDFLYFFVTVLDIFWFETHGS